MAPQGVLFASDFRTKSRWKTHCVRSTKFSNGKIINDQQKAMILGENAKRFYNSSVRFSPVAVSDASGAIRKALSGAQIIVLSQCET